MKVQIKDLKPNPFRDIKNYPFDKEKIQSLIYSIRQTGFWDNILARQINGEIQITYGHHRLEALKQVMKPTDKVNIFIRSAKVLTDAVMIQIMANENMEQWKTSIRVIDETVRVNEEFLEKYPERKVDFSARSGGKRSKKAEEISSFLGKNWNLRRVDCSLERLNLIKKGIIDKEAIEKLPTPQSAIDFVQAIKDYDLPKEKHKNVVDNILEATHGRGGRQTIIDAVFFEKYKKHPEKVKKRKEENNIIEFEKFVEKVTEKADDFSNNFNELIKLKEDFDSDFYRNMIDKYIFLSILGRLKNQIDNFLKNYNHEKNNISGGNLTSISEKSK